MALSGKFYNYPVADSNFGLYCEWSAIQNLTGLYSDITLKIYLSYYNLQVSARNDCEVSINGETETFSTSAINDYSSGWKKKLIRTQTARVYHDNEGKADNIVLSASWRFGANYEGQYVGVITAETSVSLDKITTNSVLNSVGICYVDNDVPTLPITLTIYNSLYTHTLTVVGENGLLVQFRDIKGRSGNQTISLLLDEQKKTEFLAEIANAAEKDVTCYLSTYDSTGKTVGNQSVAIGTLAVSKETASPIFTDITYKDINADVVKISGNDQYIVQSKSIIEITVLGAEGKYGAEIVSYSARIGNETKTSETNVINFGQVKNAYGENSIVVTIYDNRGFSATKEFPITIVRYTGDVSITEWSAKRKNNFGEEVTIKMSGTFPILFDNTVQYAIWGYENSEGESISGGILTPEINYNKFSYEGVLPVSFDSNKSYYLTIGIIDKFSRDTERIRLNRGTPQVEFRQGYLNINDGLRVKGNGLGFVKVLENEDNLFNLEIGGDYVREEIPTHQSYPSKLPGILRKTTAGGLEALIYHDSANRIYATIKTENGWSSWSLLSGGGGGGGITEADQIIFPEGLKTTYEFGKIKPQNGQVMNIIAPGGTLAQVFDALVDEMNPTTIQPSASITLNDAKAYEVGTTFTPMYTVTFDKGSYSYDNDTGVTETSRTITDSNGKTPPFSAFTVGDTTNYTINVEIDHTEGIVPKTNMGNYYLNGKIQAGTVEATSKAVTGYRNTFYGTLTNKNELTSTVVRGFTKSNKALSNGSSFTVDIPINALRVVIAYPSTLRDITSIKDVNGLNAEIASGFTKQTLSVEGANGYTATTYKVYVMDYAKPNDKANKYTITI